MKKKNMIFHFPATIDDSIISGSTIRPIKMINAFKSIGFNVYEIYGSSKNRAKLINMIKKQIISGLDISFVYSESANFPTILLEKDHIPRRPFIDFSFFYFIKKNKIPIGLFYRDIYWKFKTYKEEVKIYKRLITIPLFWADLWLFQYLIDILFVPSKSFIKYLPKNIHFKNIIPLPPGGDIRENYVNNNYVDENMRLLYVGNIAPTEHDISLIFEAAKVAYKIMPTVKFIISCPKNMWEKYKSYYLSINSILENIIILHKKPNELDEIFSNSDIFMLPINDEYSSMASPTRFYTAVGYGIPFIIASNSPCEVGNVVEKENMGWVIKHSADCVIELLKLIIKKKELINEKRNICKINRYKHSWEERAIYASDILIRINHNV